MPTRWFMGWLTPSTVGWSGGAGRRAAAQWLERCGTGRAAAAAGAVTAGAVRGLWHTRWAGSSSSRECHMLRQQQEHGALQHTAAVASNGGSRSAAGARGAAAGPASAVGRPQYAEPWAAWAKLEAGRCGAGAGAGPTHSQQPIMHRVGVLSCQSTLEKFPCRSLRPALAAEVHPPGPSREEDPRHAPAPHQEPGALRARPSGVRFRGGGARAEGAGQGSPGSGWMARRSWYRHLLEGLPEH